MVRKWHGGFPQLGDKLSLCYDLLGWIGPTVTPFCLFEPVTTQAVDVRRCRPAGTTQCGDSSRGLLRAGSFRLFPIDTGTVNLSCQNSSRHSFAS